MVKASSSYDQVRLPRSLALMWPEAMPWGWSRELEEVEKMKPVLGCAQAGADGHPLRKGWKETRRASGGRRRWVLLNRKSGKQWETEMRIKVKMLRRAQALLNPACLSAPLLLFSALGYLRLWTCSSHQPLLCHQAQSWSAQSCYRQVPGMTSMTCFFRQCKYYHDHLMQVLGLTALPK